MKCSFDASSSWIPSIAVLFASDCAFTLSSEDCSALPDKVVRIELSAFVRFVISFAILFVFVFTCCSSACKEADVAMPVVLIVTSFPLTSTLIFVPDLIFEATRWFLAAVSKSLTLCFNADTSSFNVWISALFVVLSVSSASTLVSTASILLFIVWISPSMFVIEVVCWLSVSPRCVISSLILVIFCLIFVISSSTVSNLLPDASDKSVICCCKSMSLSFKSSICDCNPFSTSVALVTSFVKFVCKVLSPFCLAVASCSMRLSTWALL